MNPKPIAVQVISFVSAKLKWEKGKTPSMFLTSVDHRQALCKCELEIARVQDHQKLRGNS